MSLSISRSSSSGSVSEGTVFPDSLDREKREMAAKGLAFLNNKDNWSSEESSHGESQLAATPSEKDLESESPLASSLSDKKWTDRNGSPGRIRIPISTVEKADSTLQSVFVIPDITITPSSPKPEFDRDRKAESSHKKHLRSRKNDLLHEEAVLRDACSQSTGRTKKTPHRSKSAGPVVGSKVPSSSLDNDESNQVAISVSPLGAQDAGTKAEAGPEVSMTVLDADGMNVGAISEVPIAASGAEAAKVETDSLIATANSDGNLEEVFQVPIATLDTHEANNVEEMTPVAKKRRGYKLFQSKSEKGLKSKYELLLNNQTSSDAQTLSGSPNSINLPIRINNSAVIYSSTSTSSSTSINNSLSTSNSISTYAATPNNHNGPLDSVEAIESIARKVAFVPSLAPLEGLPRLEDDKADVHDTEFYNQWVNCKLHSLDLRTIEIQQKMLLSSTPLYQNWKDCLDELGKHAQATMKKTYFTETLYKVLEVFTRLEPLKSSNSDTPKEGVSLFGILKCLSEIKSECYNPLKVPGKKPIKELNVKIKKVLDLAFGNEQRKATKILSKANEEEQQTDFNGKVARKKTFKNFLTITG